MDVGRGSNYIFVKDNTMEILRVHEDIYNQFQRSSAVSGLGQDDPDVFAAYYTAMYLIQDTAETLFIHRQNGFSPDPHRAYLEFWGVMQAICIQQDSIAELHNAITGRKVQNFPNAWSDIRNLRHTCAGHPAYRNYGVPAAQRAFMGRRFGDYNCITYELWDALTESRSHPTVNLGQMIDQYDQEAANILLNILSVMKSNWP
jgi:hypothetical protein